MNENTSINTLPKDTLTTICTFLEIDCIFALMCTSKLLSEICNDHSLWIFLIERDFLVKVQIKQHANVQYKELSSSFKRKKVIFHDMTCPTKSLANTHLYPPYGYTFSRNDPKHYVGRIFRGEVPLKDDDDDYLTDFTRNINEHQWYYEWEYYGNFSGIDVGGISKQKGYSLEKIKAIFAAGNILAPEEGESDENEKQFLVYPAARESNIPSYLFKGTFLHWACMSGKLDTVQYLISLGARTDLKLVNNVGDEWDIKTN